MRGNRLYEGRWVVAVIWLVVAGCDGAQGAPMPSASQEPLIKGGFDRAVKHNFVGVFRPQTGEWFLRMERPGWQTMEKDDDADLVFVFGDRGDTPLVGDWNGDGTETQGVWRGGLWRLGNTLGAPDVDVRFRFGRLGDSPVAGDWDGNGTTTPGVYRQGTFLLRNSNNAGAADVTIAFGDPDVAYIPLAGDWNGDGIDTVGLYEPATGRFRLTNSPTGPAADDVDVVFGNHFCQPVMGDWNGDGTPTLGVTTDTAWFLNNDFHPDDGATNDALYFSFGGPDDVPLAGDWNPHASRGSSTVPPSLAEFFPIGVDFQPSRLFATWKSRGINTVVRYPFDETIGVWTAKANELGLKMIRDARDPPEHDDGETNLLAWLTFDEPEQLPDHLAKVRARHADLRRVNPRPVFVNFNGNILLPGIDELCGGPGDLDTVKGVLDCYPDLIGTEDWVSEDYYPLNFQDQPANLGSIGQIIDKLTRWSSAKPLFAYLEASFFRLDTRTERRGPDAAELRAEIWSAIIHGARGIFYFPHDFANHTPDGTTPDVQAEMTLQNARITALAAVLQSSINPETLGFVGGEPLEATWRLFEGRAHYVVLNLSTRTLTKTMTVTGFVPSHPLEVVGEERTVGERGSPMFADTFEPYAVHVYRH